MRIDSAGDTIIQGNLKIVTDKGINFYGGTDPDTSGTATGNILNDYEEGNWTPVYQATGGSIGSNGWFSFGQIYKDWQNGYCSRSRHTH